jgi:hypothetical protein
MCMWKPLWCCCTPACMLQRLRRALLSPLASQPTAAGLMWLLLGVLQEAVALSEQQRALDCSEWDFD